MRELVRFSREGTEALCALAEGRWGRPPSPQNGPVFVGRCALAAAEPGVDLTDPRIEAARDLLDLWPKARDALAGFIDRWEVLGVDLAGLGATTGLHDLHIRDDGARVIQCSLDPGPGTASGLLHELQHIRLRALGVDIETHDGTLLASSNDERLVSPIRRDQLRPPSAIVHAALAWAAVSEAQARIAERCSYRGVLEHLLAVNVIKVAELRLVLPMLRWTPAGEPFGAELAAWLREVEERARPLIRGAIEERALARHREWVESCAVTWSPLFDDGPTPDDVDDVRARHNAQAPSSSSA